MSRELRERLPMRPVLERKVGGHVPDRMMCSVRWTRKYQVYEGQGKGIQAEEQ